MKVGSSIQKSRSGPEIEGSPLSQLKFSTSFGDVSEELRDVEGKGRGSWRRDRVSRDDTEEMDSDDFKEVLRNSGVDLWTLIETAISMAASDYGKELKSRRDGIVELLYKTTAVPCQNCEAEVGLSRPCRVEIREKEKIRSRGAEEKENINNEKKRGVSPDTPQPVGREEEEGEDEEEVGDDRRYGRPIDDEQNKITAIKDRLEDPEQSEDSLVRLLQNLADMDLTFKTLKETDIGRHVNSFRKHPSSEVRRLVKQLVRKWKDLVDEWVKSNSHENATTTMMTDGDSPQQIPVKSNQNGNHVPDFGYSPNTQNGIIGSSDKNSCEVEPKAKTIPRREAPTKPNHHPTPAASSATPAKAKEQKDSLLDPERLASARKRLHENYQEAENAKRQRTIRVMDIHDIPKPKNSFFARNKGGGFQAKHR